MRRLLAAIMIAVALASSIATILTLGQLVVSPQAHLQVQKPIFVGDSDAVRRGVSLALGKTLEAIDPLTLSIQQGDLLVVDANWLVAKASVGEVARVKSFLEALRPVLFVQAGANLTNDQVNAFTAAAGEWRIVMSFMVVAEPQDYGDLDDDFVLVPDGRSVVVDARLVQMKANPEGSYDLERFGEVMELTAYDWQNADLAVSEVATKALQQAGVVA